MKTKDEIEDRLSQAVYELECIKEWNDEAFDRYRDYMNAWGKEQADYREVVHSEQELAKISSEVNVLKWILNHETLK